MGHTSRRTGELSLSARQLSDVIQWDIATWKRALGFWMDRVPDLRGKSCLELGSRDGGLSLFFALQGASVVCTDLEGPTLAAARMHAQYGMGDHISYGRADICGIPFPADSFDIVVFKSVLGALGDQDSTLGSQRLAVAEIHRVLKPGGWLLFAENLKGSPIHELSRRRFVRWGRTWRYLAQGELEDMLRPFREATIEYGGFVAAFGRREWQRRLLHGVDRVLIPLIPVGWRYAAFGAASK